MTPKGHESPLPIGAEGELAKGTDSRVSRDGTPITVNRPTNDDVAYLKDKRWNTPFGDKRHRGGPEDNNILRLATFNIGGFPRMDLRGSTKFARMREEMINIDCVGLGELNRNWLKTNMQQSLYQRLSSWWPRQKTIQTWLKDHEWPSEYQQGGVSLTMTKEKIAKYMQEKGDDVSGLGRWVWATIEGHSDVKTVVIQAYRPPRNTKDYGSTYVQQRAASGENDPVKIFDQDILELVDGFLEEHFQVILMGDFNMPINGTSRLERELKERGIYDAIQRHYTYQKAPNTHARGSEPIDAIFVSDTIPLIRGGYEQGFTEISDHRMLWIDVHMDDILGGDRGDITRPRAKKLQITNRAVMTRFNKEFMKQINNHRLLEQATQLEVDIGEAKTMTPPQKKKYEKIDTQRCRATVCAEEKCARKPPNDTEFSVELKRALGVSILWSEITKKLCKGKRVHVRWLIDLKHRLGIKETHIDIPQDLEEAKQKSSEAYKIYKEAKQRAPELRSEFLDLIIQQAEDKGDEQKAKYLREMKAKELSRDVHRRIKVVQGKQQGGPGVKFVHKVQEDGTVATIRDKKAMEEEIAKANKDKLMSANETPVRQGALRELLTDHDYEEWEKFIRGEMTLPRDMNEGTRLWLESFQNMEIHEEDLEISTEDYVKSWNRVREHTSCTPGALHYGTFKAIRWCRPAAELHAIMARIPMKTGYTPKRWTQSTDSMLPKKKGEWRPHKLRLTSLLMPDFNHNNKILGRAAMRWAEKKKKLAPEQYGSRKNLSAEKHALNKRLMLDAMRIEKRPGVVCANDAKACYDRILHFAAYISLRRIGMKKETVISMIEPIRKMEHRVRTAYGDANTTYGGDNWDIDPSGICQGNGAGPAIWAIVSSPLFDCLRSKGYGAKLYSAISKTYLHIAGFAFVDDADTVQTGEKGDDTATLLRAAQEELDLWEELVRATGGGLEGDKSDFAVVNFKWKGGKWTYEKSSENDSLTVRNSDGTREALTQLEPHKARRTLGVWQAVDGNEKTQTEKLKKKARQWSRAVTRSSLTRHDAVIGMKTSLYPSITFGLMSTTMTEAQCDDVFKPIRQGVLPKTGYMRTMPADIIHGPTKFGGVGIKDLHTLQGIAHVKALLDEAGTDSPTGILIMQVIEGHTLEVGRSGQLFQLKYDDIEREMTTSWIKDTLRFLNKHGLDVSGTTPVLQHWREHDSLLMDDLHNVQGTAISADDREAFHRCRLHLQASTLSDITNGYGTQILESAWTCTRKWRNISSQAYRWPYQPKPTKKDREAWQRVLHIMYGVNLRYLHLPRRLGGYTKASRKEARWFFDRCNDSLYHDDGTQITRWRRSWRRTRTHKYECTRDTVDNIQRRWDIATVTTEAGSKVELQGYAGMLREEERSEIRIIMSDSTEPQEITTGPPRLDAVVKTLPGNLRWVVEKCEFPEDNGKAIAAAIIQDTGRCICDGGVKDKMGTAAAQFMDVTEEHNFFICNRTPGSDSDVHSYRSELCGILANILMVNCIAKTHDVQEGTVTLGCDNESALWAAFGTGHINANDPSRDLIKVIRHHIHDTSITWHYRHVRGHQDRQKGIQLDKWATANVAVDKAAGEYWQQEYGDGSTMRPTPARMAGEGWRVSIGSKVIVSNLDDAIYEHAYYQRCIKYWERKGRLAPGTDGEVEWNQHLGAWKLLPRSKQQWVNKHFCGFEGTNAMMFKRKERLSPICPNCAEVETHRHIVQCQSNRATMAYRNIERNFESWLQQTTSDELRCVLMIHLDAYREKETIELTDEWSPPAERASNQQTELGPNAFAEGLLVPEWGILHKEYLRSIGSKTNHQRWAKELIKKLWEVAWDMWDSRNGEVHRNQETRKEQIIAKLDAEIEEAYTNGETNHFLPRMEREFFRQSKEDILKHTEYQKRAWLHIARRYISTDRQRVVRNRSVRIMREWLRPGSTEEIRAEQRQINRRQSDLRAPEGSRRGPENREV